MPATKSDARLNFRLTSELKKTIEEAAAQSGQSISDFAVSTLVQVSRRILHEQQITRLTERDRQLFVEMLDDIKANNQCILFGVFRQVIYEVVLYKECSWCILGCYRKLLRAQIDAG